MKKVQKTALSPEDAREIVSDVTNADRDRARLAISAGVQAAQGQWIEAPLIAEALALELIAIAEHNRSGAHVAAYLRGLAEAIDTTAGYH